MHHNGRGLVRMSGVAAAATISLSDLNGAQGGQPFKVVKIVTGFPAGGYDRWGPIVKKIGFTADS